jgi:hypothetical protein
MKVSELIKLLSKMPPDARLMLRASGRVELEEPDTVEVVHVHKDDFGYDVETAPENPDGEWVVEIS